MAYNTIQIKRRLQGSSNTGIPLLSGGELAYNEKTDELYYGGEFGTLTIAGSGMYVDRVTDQTILGNKTFNNGTTTLSSTTLSPNSLFDAGANLLTNVAYPSAAADAATKQYVDDLGTTIAADFVDRTTSQRVSGTKTFFDIATFESQVNIEKGLSVTEGVSANSYNINSNIVIDSAKNAFFANIDASGNLTVQGDFTVYGNSTVIETTVTAASAFKIEASGPTTALEVIQRGSAIDIAEFKDDSNTALIIKDGGNVGINTSAPNKTLTVVGEISSTGNIYTSGNLEVNGGGANTTLYVENGKVGINTEAPNEELTVIGSISATEDIYARNGTFTGTLNVSSTVAFGSTLDVINSTTLGSTLYVSGATVINNTLSATGTVDFDSSLDVVGTTTLQSTLDVSGATVINNTLSATGTVDFDSTLNVTGATTLDSTLYVVQNATFFANVSGQQGVTALIDFIIDGGLF